MDKKTGGPGYLDACKDGRLKKKTEEAAARLEECRLCPRRCGVNRLQGETGYCRTGRRARVAGFHPHFGEEAPLVGRGGSGTIFFSSCSLLCVFCQNYDISHGNRGREAPAEELARMMLALQNQGCHNINCVTPSHVVPQILEALPLAIGAGLHVPLVYNCGGYEEVETLRLIEGVFDIYMPDIKFSDPKVAERACQAPDYPDKVRGAVIEMQRQAGDLFIDEEGLARRGLLVRHLVLPNGLAGTREVMRFLAREVSPGVYVNILFQYRPCWKASHLPELADSPAQTDFEAALQAAAEEGVTRLDRPGGFVRFLF